jgi:hypothetical protein
MDIRKHWKKAVWLLVAAVAMSILGDIWDYHDTSQRGAETFLLTDSAIRDQIGTISAYGLHKRYYFGATGDKPPYREYLYLAKGSKMKAFVTIRVDQPLKDGEPHYSVAEIRPVN